MSFEHPTPPNQEPVMSDAEKAQREREAAALLHQDVMPNIDREQILAAARSPEQRAQVEAAFAKQPTAEEEAMRLERERKIAEERTIREADEEERMRLQAELNLAKPPKADPNELMTPEFKAFLQQRNRVEQPKQGTQEEPVKIPKLSFWESVKKFLG